MPIRKLPRPILMAMALLVISGAPGSAFTGPSDLDGGLRRRAMFGAQLAPVTKEVRERQEIDGDGGVVLEQVFPGTAAAEAVSGPAT